MWFVYFLKSDTESSWLYVGSTNDLKRRIAQHQSGKVTSTQPYQPLILEGYLAVKTERKARRLEKYLKRGSGKTILKKRILQLPAGDEVEA